MPPLDTDVEDWSRQHAVRLDLPCRYDELVGRAFIDMTRRIYAVVGKALYCEGSRDPATALLPVLYIPRDFRGFSRDDI